MNTSRFAESGVSDAKTHEVRVLCSCEDIECCEIERYISDVRIAVAEIERLRVRIGRIYAQYVVE